MKQMAKVMAAAILLLGMVSGAQAEGMGQMGAHKPMKMPKNYRMVPFAKAQILQKGKTKMFCQKCGMTLPMFYRTNHAATVDGKVEQFCSMYCLVEEMNSGKKVTDIKVVDNTTLKFIDATKAFYVVGSSKPATMAKKISKYAFGTEKAAAEFAGKFGGKVMRYADALSIAKKDFADDTKAKKMRQAKGAKMGEKIYKKKCKPIEEKFTTAAEAKAYIKSSKVCGDIKGKPLQMVGLYLIGR
jgi:nitrous oxide reductase accessory protein NosL